MIIYRVYMNIYSTSKTYGEVGTCNRGWNCHEKSHEDSQ